MDSTIQRFNTRREDIESFQAVRLRYLEYVDHFKNGDPNYALPTLNSLENMYMELLYGLHRSFNPEGAATFLAKIAETRDMMQAFLIASHPEAVSKDGAPKLRVFLSKKSYLALISDLTALYVEFKQIKQELGME